MKKKLKVGFDMDGVILYNPARLVRPLISHLKDVGLIKRKRMQFFRPRPGWQTLMWRLFHKSSVFPAPGLETLRELVKKGEIEAYLITGRFSELKSDYQHWMKKIKADEIFKECFINDQNEQPHLFKERMAKELNLDVFIEDNWDIVNYLRKKLTLKVCWVYNMLDKKIDHKYKFTGLNSVVSWIQRYGKKKKTKVLVVTDYFYPHWTGISKSLVYLIESFHKKFDFSVLTTRYDRNLKKVEWFDNVRVMRSNYLFSFSRAKYSLMILFKFILEVIDNDVVLINSPFTNILPIALLTKLFGKKLVIFHQGDLILPKGFINKAIEKIFDISTKISFRLSDKISTYTIDYAQNSRVMKSFIHKVEPSIIPIPDDFNLFVQDDNRDQFIDVRNKIKSLKNKNNIVIGFAGRFVEEKGFDVLFKAISKLVKGHKNNIKFVFAGETEMPYEDFLGENKLLWNKAKKHIILLGLLDNKALQEFYENIDILVVPSRSECFGLVQAEAILQGIPVVMSNIPGARDLVKKTGMGVLFESENHNDLADKLLEVINNEDIVNDRTKKNVKKYFDKKKLLKNFISLLG